VNTGASWPSLNEAEPRVLAMQTKLHRWAAGDAGRRFDDLYNLVYDPAFLVVAWDRVRSNKGARTAGVDRVAPGAAAGALLDELQAELKARRFVPDRVREKAIPKSGGKLRRLGIPTARDRVVQASLKLVLEPIFEADFKPCSYGFRPRRRAQDAIAEIHFLASPNRNYEWVFEADIKACFDEIDHAALLSRLRRRVKDKRILALIGAFLRAGILSEEGLYRGTFTGTPQGGILSPLLANIALSVLDEHFDAKWKALGPDWTRAKHRRKGGAVWRLVRYADDFVVMVAGSRDDAEALWAEVSGILEPIGLRLSVEKTGVRHIDEGFDFLGWRIQRRVWRGRGGKRAVYTYPSKESLLAITDKVRTLTRRERHRTLADLLRRLNPVLRGWCTYFRHGVSSKTFQYLDHFVFWRVGRLDPETPPRAELGNDPPPLPPRMGDPSRRHDALSDTRDGDHSLPLPRSQDRHTMGEHGMTPWRAGCAETRTSGSEGGPRKRAARAAHRASARPLHLRPHPWGLAVLGGGDGPLLQEDRWLEHARGSRGAVGRRRDLDGDRPAKPKPGLVHHSDHGSQGSSPHGRSRPNSKIRACSPRWGPSATRSTTPSSKRSGPECRSSCSTARNGALASSSRTPSSSTSRSSTTATAVTQPSGCTLRSSTRPSTRPAKPRHENPASLVHQTGGRPPCGQAAMASCWCS
jgi:RNA-directed DNA polymerase